MRSRVPHVIPSTVLWWHLLGCIALGALACGEVSLSQPRPDAAPPGPDPSDAAPSDDAARPDAGTPVMPGPCDPASGRILACACSADTQCASGFCIDGRCCEDACDDGCASCDADGLCESHPGRLRVSASPDRSNDVPLAGQSIAGPFYAFVETCEPVDEVRFFYDEAGPLHTDGSSPYDFGGGSAGAAGHHSNIEFPKGTHSLVVELVNGMEVVATLEESFEMQPSPFDETLLYSLDPLRSDPMPLEGATLSGEVYIFLAPGPMPTQRIPVDFFLDGVEIASEGNPPYDLGAGNATANPFDTFDLADGSHELETAYIVDGVERFATARFNVNN
jgi:hypothetical protein